MPIYVCILFTCITWFEYTMMPIETVQVVTYARLDTQSDFKRTIIVIKPQVWGPTHSLLIHALWLCTYNVCRNTPEVRGYGSRPLLKEKLITYTNCCILFAPHNSLQENEEASTQLSCYATLSLAQLLIYRGHNAHPDLRDSRPTIPWAASISRFVTLQVGGITSPLPLHTHACVCRFAHPHTHTHHTHTCTCVYTYT